MLWKSEGNLTCDSFFHFLGIQSTKASTSEIQGFTLLTLRPSCFPPLLKYILNQDASCVGQGVVQRIIGLKIVLLAVFRKLPQGEAESLGLCFLIRVRK